MSFTDLLGQRTEIVFAKWQRNPAFASGFIVHLRPGQGRGRGRRRRLIRSGRDAACHRRRAFLRRSTRLARRKPGFDDNDLLAPDQDALRPLAERMRPRDLDEMVGRAACSRPAPRCAVRSSRATCIRWCCGARLAAARPRSPCCWRNTPTPISARFRGVSGLPEVRQVLVEAAQRFRRSRRTVLFVDEVHCFNKAQQDAFLPHIERGTILFVGATTENPSFEWNWRCCRGRAHVIWAADRSATSRRSLRRALGGRRARPRRTPPACRRCALR